MEWLIAIIGVATAAGAAAHRIWTILNIPLKGKHHLKGKHRR